MTSSSDFPESFLSDSSSPVDAQRTNTMNYDHANDDFSVDQSSAYISETDIELESIENTPPRQENHTPELSDNKFDYSYSYYYTSSYTTQQAPQVQRATLQRPLVQNNPRKTNFNHAKDFLYTQAVSSSADNDEDAEEDVMNSSDRRFIADSSTSSQNQRDSIAFYRLMTISNRIAAKNNARKPHREKLIDEYSPSQIDSESDLESS